MDCQQVQDEILEGVNELHAGTGNGIGGEDETSENTALTVEIQKRWFSASRNLSGRSLDDPMLGDELFNDQRDRTPLQARSAGQVGTRNRLLGANLVEDEIPVDLTCDSIRRAQISVHKETRRWHILLPPPT